MSLTRRRFLRSSAAAGATLGSGASAVFASVAAPAGVAAAISTTCATAAPSRDAPLFNLALECRDAADALEKAENDLDWLVAESRHLWPLAPEEILFQQDAHIYAYKRQPERDLGGRLVFRRVEKRAEGRATCFSLHTSAELREQIRDFSESPVSGRTVKSLARNTRERRKYIARLEAQATAAERYERETANLRKTSGAASFVEREKQARSELSLLVGRICDFPAYTFAGMGMKATVFLAFTNSVGLGPGNRPNAGIGTFGWSLAEDIQRVREQEGGAA